ncbi:MAG: FAD-dependent oxidoreductase, partial [Acidobacteriales bacterium]|nr:FAD-dependent oxidoreductase [Terriglobales bacterium]
RTIPQDNGESFQHWLQLHHQPRRAIEHFWKPVLVSALNEDLDRISVPYAAQVFRESFLKSSTAGRMGVPMAPLTELYSEAGRYITERGGEVRYRSSVDSFDPQQWEVKPSVAGEKTSFDFAIIAVSYDALARLLPPDSDVLRGMLSHFESSPITGIHLWFDRQITELEHAILLDRTIQWMFHKSRILQRYSGAQVSGSYVELVVSASKSLVEKAKTEIVELALSELREFFPAAREAKLLKSAVVKEIHATYSPLPGVDAYRPAAQTSWPRIFLAGDYTVTGWPATMEGAVRSGYIAAGGVAKAAGVTKQFVSPDLPASGLMRLFG